MVFRKKDVLKKFAENAEKTCDESFFNEVLGLLVWNIVEKRLQHTFFPLSFAKTFKNIYFKEHSLLAKPPSLSLSLRYSKII